MVTFLELPRVRRGFSLMEVIVAAAILALAIPLLLNLLPTGFLSLRKAHSLETATSFALYRMDEVPFLTPQPGVDVQETLQVGSQQYLLVREFYRVDSVRWDVVVSCGCPGLTPVRLATRLIRSSS